MAKAAGRSSANTDLFIGTLKASVGLFGTQAKPGKEASFDTAGPRGGVLRYEKKAAAVPVGAQTVEAPDLPVSSDPLGPGAGERDTFEDPGPAALPPGEWARHSAALLEKTETVGVEGEFVQVLVEDGEDGPVEVPPEDVRRGVRLDDGRFIDLTEQVDAITERTKLDRIEVVRCIDSTQVTRERVVGAYYIGAQDDDAVGPLRLLYEALRRRREVAVVKYTTKTRQQIGVIAPHARTGTLVLLSLVFAEDFREPPAKAKAIAKAQVSEAQVEKMRQLLALLHGGREVFDELRDDAIALREELVTRARAGEMDVQVVDPVTPEEAGLDLEDALAASLDAVRAGKV